MADDVHPIRLDPIGYDDNGLDMRGDLIDNIPKTEIQEARHVNYF